MKNVPIELTAFKLGAKKCPNCDTADTVQLTVKNLGHGAIFCEIQCNRCMRISASETQATTGQAIREAVYRWNTIWPDIAYYLEGTSEGTIWMTQKGGFNG